MFALGSEMTPKTSVFVVSYGVDVPWLVPMFKSFSKNLSGFHEIVLAFPTRDLKVLKKYCPWLVNNKPEDGPVFDCPVKLVEFDEEPMDGHIASLYAKCTADQCTSGDFVLFCDSDCVFFAPTDPEIYFDLTFGAKPIWVYRPFEIRNQKPWPSHWKECTSEALGFEVAYETMARHPSLTYRSMLPAFRTHIEQIHGRDLYDYLLPRKRHGHGSKTFSEFCSLGAFAFYYWHNRYRWIEDGPETPPTHLKQFWSFHTVNNPDVQAKLKEFGLLT